MIRRALPAVSLLILLSPALVSAQASERAYFGPYSVYGPGLSYAPRPDYTGPLAVRQFATTVPLRTTIGIQTTVNVPDGGTVLLGGFNTFREGRNEFGTPVLGKVPVLGRPFRNVGYGYSVQSGTVTARVRVIDLAEMDARILQNGR